MVKRHMLLHKFETIMGFSSWGSWILLHVIISLPAIGLMYSTRSSTVPLMQRCDSFEDEPDYNTSCVGRCGDTLNRSLSCQCNSPCGRYKDCCSDFDDVCNTTSCKWRCNQQRYLDSIPCQCNDKCQDNYNCCEDYTEMCQGEDTTPTVECDVTSYVKGAVDMVEHLSNDTYWTCIENDAPSIHWLPNCSCPIGPDDLAVNLTKGLTTKINCSALSNASISSPKSYSYTWRMNAPPNSRIRLLVYHSEGITITATNEDRANSGHTFSLDDNDYVSASNTVIINASLHDFKQGHLFMIEGWALEESVSDSSVSPVAIVLPTILLIVVGVSVFWILCRRRKVLTERKNLYCQSSDGPVNSTCNTVSSDHHGGPLYSVQHGSPLVKMQPDDASRTTQQQQNDRAGTSIVIYNEIGEENYSVLFSGKEQGDYHTYVLPDRPIPELAQEGQKTSNQSAGTTNHSDLQKQLGQEEPGNNHSYDVLEAGNETSPATGLISQDGSSSTRVDPDSEAQEGKPKEIPDDAAHKPYDHPRQSAPEVLENHADSPTRHDEAHAEDDLANTYTTLDADPKDDGEYSHLQRPLGINLPSGHHHLGRDPCNEYGKLGGNTR
ncbi:uncharacterized protein LOC121430786 [Lytechinus variegatus]|uniref:uncharacterized protein LOC121430786 n=1 Tax=Lytechinus variegatus TaxID=7654 RepID=UPI001BB28C9E|nr:uncharacterized protein LOC121430786 [Lytechinus variegatus]